jgi:hypothetical protein
VGRGGEGDLHAGVELSGLMKSLGTVLAASQAAYEPTICATSAGFAPDGQLLWPGEGRARSASQFLPPATN